MRAAEMMPDFGYRRAPQALPAPAGPRIPASDWGVAKW